MQARKRKGLDSVEIETGMRGCRFWEHLAILPIKNFPGRNGGGRVQSDTLEGQNHLRDLLNKTKSSSEVASISRRERFSA